MHEQSLNFCYPMKICRHINIVAILEKLRKQVLLAKMQHQFLQNQFLAGMYQDHQSIVSIMTQWH